MSNEQARKCFNEMIEAFRARGMNDRAAEMEIAREYFLNPEFRQTLADYLWAQSERNR